MNARSHVRYTPASSGAAHSTTSRRAGRAITMRSITARIAARRSRGTEPSNVSTAGGITYAVCNAPSTAQRRHTHRAACGMRRRRRNAAAAIARKVYAMNKQGHLANWDQMRLRHGITLRLLEQIPDDQLTRHPIAGMRTPVELLVHMYAG